MQLTATLMHIGGLQQVASTIIDLKSIANALNWEGTLTFPPIQLYLH